MSVQTVYFFNITVITFFIYNTKDRNKLDIIQFLVHLKSSISSTVFTFCTHSLESNASNIQRSLRNECFPVDSNVKIAKNTGPLRHSKKICHDNNKI
jgi:hypothetical protein